MRKSLRIRARVKWSLLIVLGCLLIAVPTIQAHIGAVTARSGR